MKPSTEEVILAIVNDVKKTTDKTKFVVAVKSDVFEKLNLDLFNNYPEITISTFDAVEIDYNLDMSNITKDVLVIPM